MRASKAIGIIFVAAWFAACTPSPPGGPSASGAAVSASGGPAEACELFTPAELGALRVELAPEQPGGIPPMSSPGGQLDRTLCNWIGGVDGDNYSINLQAYLWRAERDGAATEAFYRQVVGARDGMTEIEPGLLLVDNGHAVEFWLIKGRYMVEVGYIADDAGAHREALLAMAQRISASL